MPYDGSILMPVSYPEWDTVLMSTQFPRMSKLTPAGKVDRDFGDNGRFEMDRIEELQSGWIPGAIFTHPTEESIALF